MPKNILLQRLLKIIKQQEQILTNEEMTTIFNLSDSELKVLLKEPESVISKIRIIHLLYEIGFSNNVLSTHELPLLSVKDVMLSDNEVGKLVRLSKFIRDNKETIAATTVLNFYHTYGYSAALNLIDLQIINEGFFDKVVANLDKLSDTKIALLKELLSGESAFLSEKSQHSIITFTCQCDDMDEIEKYFRDMLYQSKEDEISKVFANGTRKIDITSIGSFINNNPMTKDKIDELIESMELLASDSVVSLNTPIYYKKDITQK